MDKFNLVVRAAKELTRAVQENYYDLSDLNIINYSEVCDWCNLIYKTEVYMNRLLMWQQKTINLNTCYSTGFNAIAITILAMAAEMLSIAFGLTTSRNKSIKCESFTICCG